MNEHTIVERTSMIKNTLHKDSRMSITSVFEHEGRIPEKYTCSDADINPPLTINGIPKGTQSLALIHDDPDAPVGTWVHWLIWNIIPTGQEFKIMENSQPEGAILGKNDFGRTDYGGPCPPSGTHRYFYKVYALNKSLDLKEGTSKKELEAAMTGHIIAQTELIGTYSRD